MAILKPQRNMGQTDRLFRGIIGAFLLCNGLRNRRQSPLRTVEAVLGGTFLTHGLTGFDPLLFIYGASTIGGTENSIWRQLKAALPGQGIKPILSQSVLPAKNLKKPFLENVPLSQALTVG